MITDSELSKLAENWFKEQPINLGAKTAFAAGYRFAELKNCNLQNVSHCACSVDETTGWTQVKCCNICGKPLKDQNWHCG